MSSEDTFEATLSHFKARLTSSEQDDFQFTTLTDVHTTIARIQEKSMKTMTNLSRIESFVQAMTEFCKVIEVLVPASKYVAFIWGPVKYLLQVRQRPWLSSFIALVFLLF